MEETIRYARGTSSLGDFIVAASARGVVALEFTKRESSVTAALETWFRDAALVEDSASMKDIVEKAASLIEHPAAATGLPVDMHGSEFERQVWSALREIPPGRTISYGELASRLGVPGLAHEVGAACAANTIAVVIPCHRVLKKNGGIAGYRWGSWRKRVLLEREYLDHFSLT
jgi:AraC family transcriptional regulator of adaptative response/methylated-DNA-[protein]-cysteine methyltransferase